MTLGPVQSLIPPRAHSFEPARAARELAYRETWDKYGALIADARKDVSLASY